MKIDEIKLAYKTWVESRPDIGAFNAIVKTLAEEVSQHGIMEYTWNAGSTVSEEFILDVADLLINEGFEVYYPTGRSILNISGW
jgi:hypothetical protein